MSEIRDPIYGFIEPSEGELKIINTGIFQRLRKIKQLALANLVYPTANHTRFDHSLGVLYVAKIMAEKLLPGSANEEKRRIIRFAALLHDIGHGPFSHVSEYLLKKYSSKTATDDTEKIHESITSHLIQTNKEIKNILSPDDRKQISGLLSDGNVELSLMKEIVSGPLDADKQDYLLRDSYFCGVKYGVYDLYRLINTLHKSQDNNDEHLCIKYDGVNALEQFVLAKYYMIKQVYYHKIRLVTDAMLIRGVELGIEKDGISFFKKLYCYEDKEDYFDNYVKWWDDRFFAELLSNKYKGSAKNIFKRLFERNLFKTIYSIDLRKSRQLKASLKKKISEINSFENKKFKKEIEKKVAKVVGVEPEYVTANSITIKSVRTMSRDSEGIVAVEKKDGKISNFEQESTVFQSINESLKDVCFEIYAPVFYKDQRDKKEKSKNYEKEIGAILKEEK
jgi:HD superfamily phosphohydrolase